jgi:hypothetical protein
MIQQACQLVFYQILKNNAKKSEVEWGSFMVLVNFHLFFVLVTNNY